MFVCLFSFLLSLEAGSRAVAGFGLIVPVQPKLEMEATPCSFL